MAKPVGIKNKAIVENYIKERHQRLWRETFVSVVLGTLANASGAFNMIARVIIPILLGVSAIFSPAVLFALAVTDFVLNTVWWLHMHYEVYEDSVEHPAQTAYMAALEAQKNPETTGFRAWWSAFTGNNIVAHALTFVPNALFTAEAALMLIAPAIMGLASPILVVAGFGVFMVRGLLDTASLLLDYFDAKRERNRAITAAENDLKLIQLLQNEQRLANNKILWDVAFHTLTVAGLTVGFALLMLVPMAPLATLATGMLIAGSTMARITLRLLNPGASVPYHSSSAEVTEKVGADAINADADADADDRLSYCHEKSLYTAQVLWHMVSNWNDTCHEQNAHLSARVDAIDVARHIPEPAVP